MEELSEDHSKGIYYSKVQPESSHPIYQSYDIEECPGIYAGEYPGDLDDQKAIKKVNQLVKFGIKHFIDLTEENELKPYEHLLPEGVIHHRFPIHDCCAPKSVEEVHKLIKDIEDFQKDGGYVYIHCWGGIGRTGTIVSCLLAKTKNIKQLDDVLKILRRNFSKMPKSSFRKTPETRTQFAFIKSFIESCQ